MYLDAPIECLLERIGEAGSRPLLAGLDAAGRAERLAALLEARRPWYAAADQRVDASGSPDEVVERIVSRLTGHGAA